MSGYIVTGAQGQLACFDELLKKSNAFVFYRGSVLSTREISGVS